MRTFLQDVRYGARMLRKYPGSTAIAVIALGLGIASSTAIFSIVDHVLLRPLPFPKAEQILEVTQSERSTGAWKADASPANYLDWRAQNHVFAEMTAARGWPANLTGDDRPERIRTTMVTGSFFRLFGIAPLIGRAISAADETPGTSRVAVLSYGIWQGRYGADPNIVGRDVTLDGQPYRIIGVMPQNYGPDRYGELWIASPWQVPNNPLRQREDPRPLRDSNYLNVWARLKPGVTLAQANADMDVIARQLEQQYPNANKDTGICLRRMQDEFVGNIRPVLLVLSAAVGFVLLIACANVANLLLARASGRAAEISIRAALGASRSRLVRQLLTESILLALLGGGLGVLLAQWAVPALAAFTPTEFRFFNIVALDRSVLAFTVVISLFTGVIFGLAPAVYASGIGFNRALHDAQRGSSSGRIRGRGFLIGAQVAVSLVLLIGAGLMLKSVAKLTRVDPGFDSGRLLVFNIGYPSSAAPTQQTAFYQQVIERLRALPGVTSAAAISRLPFTGGNSTRSFNLPGDEESRDADVRVITPEYFQTMRIPVLRGRAFTEHDSAAGALVCDINAAAAREFFGTEDPVGKFITNFGPNKATMRIVGVVGSVRHLALETAPRPEIYQPLGQAQWPSMFVVMRSAAPDPRTLISSAQNAVWKVDKNVPLANVRAMQDMVADSVVRRKFAMLLLAIFAGLAVLLAAVGLYGVMSFSVAQRTREIGIRVALGAQRGDVVRLVINQAMLFVGSGVAAGLVGSVGLTRLMSGLLFGVSPTDAGTFTSVASLLAGIALLACWIPARRATRVDPVIALRTE
jgi:putative ABC transport system permease protein